MSQTGVTAIDRGHRGRNIVRVMATAGAVSCRACGNVCGDHGDRLSVEVEVQASV